MFRIVWELVASKKECCGPGNWLDVGEFSIEHCAASCYGRGYLFAYGTNEFGTQRCKNVNQCSCICWTIGGSDGVCEHCRHAGYRLYKISSTGRFILFNMHLIIILYVLDFKSKFTEFSFKHFRP